MSTLGICVTFVGVALMIAGAVMTLGPGILLTVAGIAVCIVGWVLI